VHTSYNQSQLGKVRKGNVPNQWELIFLKTVFFLGFTSGSGQSYPTFLPSTAVTGWTPLNCPIHATCSSSTSLQHTLKPIQSPWRLRRYVPQKCLSLHDTEPNKEHHLNKTTPIYLRIMLNTRNSRFPVHTTLE